MKSITLLLPTLFLAFCEGFQIFAVYHYLNIKTNWYVVIGGFMITLGVYLLNKVSDIEDKENRAERYSFFNGSKFWLYFAGVLLAAPIVLLLFTGRPQAIFFTLSVVAICIVYNYWLKKVFFLKTIITVGIWSAAAIGIVVTMSPFTFREYDLVLVALVFFVSTLNGNLRSDMRDIVGDKANNVNTIPVVFGISHTYTILDVVTTLTIYLFAIMLIVNRISLAFFLFAYVSIVWGFAGARIPLKYKGWVSEIFIDSQLLAMGMLLLTV